MSGGGGGSGRRSPAPDSRGAWSSSSSSPSLFSVTPKVPNDDNLFVRQMELMLSKSASNQAAAAAAAAAASSPATAASSTGLASSGEDWRLSRPVRVEASTRATVSGSSWAGVGGCGGGGGSGGSVPRSWKEVGNCGSFSCQSGLPSTTTPAKGWPAAEPKAHNGRVPTDVAKPPRRRPMSIFDGMGSSDSSDNDDDGAPARMFGGDTMSGRSAEVSAAGTLRSSLSMAEPKKGPVLFSWEEDTNDNRGGGGSDSPGPSSDGGWPETKRCPPPNLRECSPKSSNAASNGFVVDGGGYERSKREDEASSRPSIRRGPAASDGSGVAGGRSDSGARFETSRTPPSAEAKRDGLLTAAGHNPTSLEPTTKSRAGNGVRYRRCYLDIDDDDDDDWMSDADDRIDVAPPAVAAAPSQPRTGRSSCSHGGLKRSRSPPAQSPGDGGGSCDGCRVDKAGRSEHYPTPVPRSRQRSSSLSLSPRRVTAFDSDYDSDVEPNEPPAVSDVARKKGAGSTSSRRGLSTSQRRGGRGHKRRHEDILNDRIGAMRVGSAGEEQSDGGTKQEEEGGRRRGHARTRGGGARALVDDDAWQEEEDEIDYEDLKPNIEDPPWLSPLEPYDLGGGASINPSINRYLRDFQREGVKWLHSKFIQGKGGILGDDMGLGKTVQSISFISAVLQKTGTRQDREELKRRRQAGVPASACGLPFLIVAPASVVRVWMDHLETWGHFESFQLESGKDIDRLMSDLLSGRVEVVTTSYDLLRLHANRLTKTRFEAVLFDEYHTIKSASAMVSQAACELRTKRVFGFTGTLIQNDMKEFWFLAHLIDPLAVGEQTRFTEHFSEPIKRARSAKATNDDRRLSNKRLDELDSIRSKIMIQRTKEAVLADLLLGKSDTVVFCDVSEVQRDLYLSVLALPEFQLLKRAKEPCDCGRRGPPRRGRCCYKLPYDPASNGGGGGGGGDGIDPRAVLFRKFHATGQECPKCPSCCQLAAVAKLQKIANHPCLLQENLLDTEDKRKNQRLFAEVAFTDRAKETMGGLVRSQNFLKTSKTEVCGKLAALEILLEKFYRTRDKVLVFSWSTTMLDVIESFVGAKGYSYRRLDGSTQAKDRRTRIKDFNSDRKGVFVFLISTGAGGQGLNLCTASRVVMYDANWNPAKEAQAQDRAYRIGQKNKVAVFRLISKGTIEEVIYMRQIYKLQITSAAMGDEARGGRRQFYAVQGSKGEEGELFGIQNLLKFSDDSLLKALRTKYDTSSRAGGGSNNAGNGGNNAKNLGVDAADEGELLLAMQEGVGRAQQEQEESGDPDPEDAELADLLGVLGLDAYTHDELVAKDEGEEELTQEASVSAELPLSLLELERPRSALEKTTTPLGRVARGQVTASSSSAIPVGSPLKFRRSLIPAQPGENITAAAKSRSDGGGRRGRIKNSPVTAVTDTTKRSSGGGAGSGAVGLVGRSPKARPGVISPLKLERVSREGTPVKETRPGLLAGNGGASSKTVSVRGAPSTTRTEAVGGCMERQPALPQGVVGPAPPHEPCKRRRNLDWGRGAGVVKVGLGDGAGGSGSGGRYKLFTPRYGASSGVSGGGGGGEK